MDKFLKLSDTNWDGDGEVPDGAEVSTDT